MRKDRLQRGDDPPELKPPPGIALDLGLDLRKGRVAVVGAVGPPDGIEVSAGASRNPAT